ncbi:hypothetical protein ACIMS2_002339 [Vibrio harveyi]
MNENIKNNRLSLLSETCMESVISYPQFRKGFREWERLHLAQLIRQFKGYKTTLPISSKVKSITKIEHSEQLKLIKYLANSANISLPSSNSEIEKYARFFVGDVVCGGNTVALNDIKDKMSFLLPPVMNRISELLDDVDYVSCALNFSGINLIEETEYLKDGDEEADTEENVEQITSVSCLEAPMSLDISNILSMNISELLLSRENESNSAISQIVFLLNILFSRQENISKIINSKAEKLVDQEILFEFDKSVKNYTANEIPRNVKTYRAILSNIKELPHGKGHVGEIVSIEDYDGQLISISNDIAMDLFPSRGCAYIPQKILNKPIHGFNILPVEIADVKTGGVNDYKVESYWGDVVEIVSCKHGFYDFEQLVEELKSFVFSGGRHSVWFKLSDGSLLSPSTRKDKITTQLFFEKWKYISSDELSSMPLPLPYILRSDLPSPKQITMISDSAVLKELSSLEGDDLIPEYLIPRVSYLKEASNVIIKTDEFVSDFVTHFISTKPIDGYYHKFLDDYFNEHSPEMKSMNEELERLSIEIEDRKRKTEELRDKYSELETRLIGRVESRIKNIHNDIVKVTEDPLLMAIFSRESYARDTPTQVFEAPQADKESCSAVFDLIYLNEEKPLRMYFNDLGITMWNEDEIDKFREGVEYFIRNGFVFQIVGEKAYKISELMLRILSKGSYLHRISIFADSVESSLRQIAEKSDTPIVVSGVSEHQINMFRPVLSLRYQSSMEERNAIFFVFDGGDGFFNDMENVITLNREMLIAVEGDLYDSEDFDTDFGKLPKSVDKYVSNENGVLTDLLYTSLTNKNRCVS